jgi:hypothetical protein
VKPYTYAVEVPGIGTIHKRDDRIKDARMWARRAFGPGCTVARYFEPKPATIPTGSILRRFPP